MSITGLYYLTIVLCNVGEDVSYQKSLIMFDMVRVTFYSHVAVFLY